MASQPMHGSMTMPGRQAALQDLLQQVISFEAQLAASGSGPTNPGQLPTLIRLETSSNLLQQTAAALQPLQHPSQVSLALKLGTSFGREWGSQADRHWPIRLASMLVIYSSTRKAWQGQAVSCSLTYLLADAYNCSIWAG